MVNARTEVPDPDAWAAALQEYASGRVLRLPMDTSSGREVFVAVTATWVATWRELPLTDTERVSIRNGCRSIAQGWPHPALGARPLDLAPAGAWIGVPTAGYAITWRPHWSSPEVPVLLTITPRLAAPVSDHDPSPAGPTGAHRVHERRYYAAFYSLPRPRAAAHSA